jgi:phosphosulfolactate phosphohydrolase-like enzyme
VTSPIAPLTIEVASDVDLGRSHYDVVVVIDVIRAMTTACVLIDQGVPELLLAENMHDLRSMSSAQILVADLERETEPPHDHGRQRIFPNSPAILAGQATAGKRIAMYTQNGTKALLNAPSCDLLLGAATVNLTATVERIHASEARTVLLVPSDFESLEDRISIRHYVTRLSGTKVDPELVSAGVWAGAEEHRKAWEHLVSREAWRNFEADVSICAGVDTVPFSLQAGRDSTGRLRLRRADVLE